MSTTMPQRRPDIMARPLDEDGQFRVEDPLNGRVFQIGVEEHFLLEQCDGRQNLQQVRTAFADRFGKSLSDVELDEFLNLVVGEELTTDQQELWRTVNDTWWNMSPDGALAGREAAVEETREARLKKYRRFFWEYDRQSHPMLTDHNPDIPEDEKPRRKHFVCDAFAILSDRVLRRAELYREGRIPAPGELVRPSDPETVQYLSTFQLDLIHDCLPTSSGDIDLAAFEEAFEMFGNAELRVEEQSMPGPSESNNGNNFSFAEFAFLAIESGVDVDEWTRLLNPLVRMQRIFMKVYRPDGPGPYSFCDYRPANFAPEKQVDAEFKRALREEYSGWSVQELAEQAGRNAYRAFGAGWKRELNDDTDRTTVSQSKELAMNISRNALASGSART